jgi:hypothetical protein
MLFTIHRYSPWWIVQWSSLHLGIFFLQYFTRSVHRKLAELFFCATAISLPIRISGMSLRMLWGIYGLSPLKYCSCCQQILQPSSPGSPRAQAAKVAIAKLFLAQMCAVVPLDALQNPPPLDTQHILFAIMTLCMDDNEKLWEWIHRFLVILIVPPILLSDTMQVRVCMQKLRYCISVSQTRTTESMVRNYPRWSWHSPRHCHERRFDLEDRLWIGSPPIRWYQRFTDHLSECFHHEVFPLFCLKRLVYMHIPSTERSLVPWPVSQAQVLQDLRATLRGTTRPDQQ